MKSLHNILRTTNTMLMIVILFASCAEQHRYYHKRSKKNVAAKVDYQRALLNSLER